MACEVVRKHYESGRRLVVYTRDVQRLERFNSLLWAYDATAFVPHVLHDDALAAQTPVVLTSSDPLPPVVPEASPRPWLINLDLKCPPGAEKFERILEIVSNHDDDKLAARERWREYQAGGHVLHAHDVSGRQS
jgi:DNA polymerase-3 subunit chi